MFFSLYIETSHFFISFSFLSNVDESTEEVKTIRLWSDRAANA